MSKQPDNQKPTDIEHATKVGDTTTIIADNHIDEILMHLVANSYEHVKLMYKELGSYPLVPSDIKDKLSEHQSEYEKLRDSAKKQLDQYYADFYRNKMLEARKEELIPIASMADPEVDLLIYEMVNKRLKELGEKTESFLPPEDNKLCKECGFAEWRHGFGSSHQFTAQFNSKEGNDEAK